MLKAIFIFLMCLWASTNGLSAQSVDSLERALAKAKYPEQKSILLKKLAWTYRNINLKKALDHAHEALDLAKKNNNRKLEAEVTRMIGVMYLHFAYHSEGLEWTQRALLLSQEIDFDEGVGFCYDSFGVTYYYQKKYIQAEEYFQNALKIFEKINHTEGIGYVYTHLVWIYRETNRLELALDAGHKALDARKKFGDMRLYANTIRDISQIYDKKGDLKTALEYMWRAIGIMEKIDKKPFIDEHYQVMSMIWYKHNPDSALHYAGLAYQYADLRGDKRQKVLIYDLYAKIYKDRKDYTNAFKYQTLHYQYQDSVYNDNIARNNASLEARFEYKQREKIWLAQQKQREAETKLQIQQQWWLIYFMLLIVGFLAALFFVYYTNSREKQRLNELLDEQNQELEMQAEILLESNLFKDKLFSIISHDLRAPLGQVQGTLEILQSGVLEQEEFEEILPTLLRNTLTTMDLLDNLLLWAKTQIQGQSVDRQYFDIQDIVDKNIKLFLSGAIQKGIMLKSNFHTQMQVFGDRNMIDLVLRNFINNAIKFCEEDDAISIEAEEVENMLHVCVHDTGTGISAENVEKLLTDKIFTEKGTAGEKGTGLGIKLCKDFILKNKGKFWIESEVGKGSKFYFSVPLKANF